MIFYAYKHRQKGCYLFTSILKWANDSNFIFLNVIPVLFLDLIFLLTDLSSIKI